ncbi:GtrA family protein [Sulfobacillus sp. DSM 109850]|uniref:GtrA family protein n=1 Tax=Sulfobacillus harzensis TaxID=2729629 RepID=A0A7Y0Q558_9FIRM|nr:GtrA family protein [Sulfobacillus harzensis]
MAWMASVVLYREAHVPYLVAHAFGFVAGTAVNFPLSRVWAFRRRGPHAARQLVVFVGGTLGGLLINEATVREFVREVKFPVSLAMALGLASAFALNQEGPEPPYATIRMGVPMNALKCGTSSPEKFVIAMARR